MIQIDLTKEELFKNFAISKVNDIEVDLHNCFECYSINYSSNAQLTLIFKAIEDRFIKIDKVELVFKNVIFESMIFNLSEKSPSNWLVDNFYRGTFINPNTNLEEDMRNGKYYYRLNFYDDYSFEILSDSVTADVHLR